jgi:YihY family inner membrane protein
MACPTPVVLGSTVLVSRAVAAEARRQQITFLAAALAYYAFVSLLPLLVLATVLGSVLFGEEIAGYLVSVTGDLLAPTAREMVRETVVSAAGREEATAVGVVLLLWSGLRLFRALDVAFSRVYGAPPVESLVEQVYDALVAFASIAVAVLAVVLLGAVLPALAHLPLVDAAAFVLLFVALMGVFFPIYYLFPDVPITPREALPGAAVVAGSWTLLTEAFRLYAANAGSYAVYGALGAVVLLVTWLYVAGIVIMLGGILNAVLAGRTNSETTADAPDPESEAVEDEESDPVPDVVALRRELDALEDRVEKRTVDREDIESDLRQYVRSQIRHGHARDWGPYLVLLYGTAMTIAAFFSPFLTGLWAIFGMVVIWLSTLGLYVVMLIVGAGLSTAGVPGRIFDWVRNR